MHAGPDTLSSLSATDHSCFGTTKSSISPDKEQQSKYWNALYLRPAFLPSLYTILHILMMDVEQ